MSYCITLHLSWINLHKLHYNYIIINIIILIFIEYVSLLSVQGCELEGRLMQEGETTSLSVDRCTSCTCMVIVMSSCVILLVLSLNHHIIQWRIMQKLFVNKMLQKLF